MKGPKPRDYGLDSDHYTMYADHIPADPGQPYTDEELIEAATRLIKREALAHRQGLYQKALDEHRYNQGGR